MPNLLDPNFYRTVVLVLEHDEEGALGLVLNRVSALTTQELCINQGVIWRGRNEQVRVGAPSNPRRSGFFIAWSEVERTPHPLLKVAI